VPRSGGIKAVIKELSQPADEQEGKGKRKKYKMQTTKVIVVAALKSGRWLLKRNLNQS
jgi:hypothetical protein